MRNRIAQKLLLYFIIPLCIFALMSGILFQTLFTREITEEKERELTARAGELSDTLSNASDSSASNGMGMGKNTEAAAEWSMGLSAYLPALSLLDVDVWVLDANLNFLTTGRRMMTIAYKDLPPDADNVVDQVFAGETVVSRGFSDLLGAPTVTVGVPIYPRRRHHRRAADARRGVRNADGDRTGRSRAALFRRHRALHRGGPGDLAELRVRQAARADEATPP